MGMSGMMAGVGRGAAWGRGGGGIARGEGAEGDCLRGVNGGGGKWRVRGGGDVAVGFRC